MILLSSDQWKYVLIAISLNMIGRPDGYLLWTSKDLSEGWIMQLTVMGKKFVEVKDNYGV
jgi:hypothetical protein